MTNGGICEQRTARRNSFPGQTHVRESVSVAVLRLNDACSQSKAQRFCHITLAVGEQSRVPLFDFRPGDGLGFLNPAVAFFQIHSYRLFEVRKTDLAVTVAIHTLPPSARLLPVFLRFPYTYYIILWSICLDISGFFICSGGIN